MENQLLLNIKANYNSLEELLNEINSDFVSENYIYRFYHGSIKVMGFKVLIKQICDLLEKISPHKCNKIRNIQFLKIINDGLNVTWDSNKNLDWMEVTNPLLGGFFHAKYFLEMAVKYGKRNDLNSDFPDFGWAALLSLYQI